MSSESAVSKTILAVDDKLENLKILIKYLEDSGYELMVARSGEEALQHVDRITPDIILLDVLMPGIDGFETCIRLKQNKATKNIPVIFMTALTDTVDKVKGFEVGAADYLTKPLQHEEVLARINTHLSIRKFQQQLQKQNTLLQQKNSLLKKQKNELRESEARFRQLAEATFEGILIHDEGRIIDGNEALQKMFGFPRQEVVGKNILEFLTLESRDMAINCMQTKCENPYEAEGIRKDGSRFPLEIQGKTMPHQGKDLRIVAIRDLTRHRAMEEEKARIQQENLNFSMKTLRFVTHELKSPLATMQTMITVMLEGYMGEVSEDVGSYLQRIRHSCEDLQDMIKNYLDISRLGMGELVARKAPINYYKEIVEPCVEQTQILFESREVILSVDCPVDLTVQADHDLLRIALTNYLTNAAKYASPQTQARLNVSKEKGNIFTSVFNEGMGFLPGEQNLLFEKFSRLKNENTMKQRGSGLGLYLVKNIIQLHGGKVWAESTPNKWAKFCFSFPTGDESIVNNK
jgi:PAS domain S-box-containing protein